MIELFDKPEHCCGCSACRAACPVSAISFYTDDKGFEYPSIDRSLCINCGLCVRVCDLKQSVDESRNAVKIYAAKIKDDEVRMRSSSGGMFSAFSDYFLQRGGTVYGAAHNENLETVHIRADNVHDRDNSIGSKYVQSHMGNVFSQVREDLKSGKDVFFTGTPCQVAGLNSCLRHSSCPTDKLFTADLVCHGVPSPRLFSEFITFCEKRTGKKIIEYLHRPKTHYGWSHNEKIIYSDGECDDTSSLVLVWRTLFYSNVILRPSCYECKYATHHRYGDITIADFWGIENTMPDFFDDKGVSLLFLNTDKSDRVFAAIKNSLITQESSLEACTPYNINLLSPSVCKLDLDKFWQFYHENGFEAVARRYGGYDMKHKIKKRIKNILEKMHLLEFVKKIYR